MEIKRQTLSLLRTNGYMGGLVGKECAMGKIKAT